MKSITLNNINDVKFCQGHILELPLDGSFTVDIRKTPKSNSDKQRRLNWMWCTQVAESGIGRKDTKEEVYIESKWMFARPILLREDEVFGILYNHFVKIAKSYDDYPEKCYLFADKYISIEKMSMANRAEYLRDFQRYWLGKGVNLTDPDLIGLKGFL